MIAILARESLSVGEIGAELDISLPATSRHLKVLRRAGLVEDHRDPDDNRVRMYRLVEGPLVDLKEWLEELEKFWCHQLSSFKRHAETKKKATR